MSDRVSLTPGRHKPPKAGLSNTAGAAAFCVVLNGFAAVAVPELVCVNGLFEVGWVAGGVNPGEAATVDGCALTGRFFWSTLFKIGISFCSCLLYTSPSPRD